MRYAIGVDIGGTKVAIGIVDENGKLIKDSIIPTDLTISPNNMIIKTFHTIDHLIKNSIVQTDEIIGIGIGAPGPLDLKNGLISCPPNLPGWVNIDIVNQFQQHYPSLPVVLQNDANAATLAEKWVGAAQKNDHFIYLTISTGIGAGFFSDGKLLSGSRGNAGDIGHMVIDPSYGTCSCGQKGCFEWIASGTSIARIGSEIVGKRLTTKEVFDLYHKGEPEIISFVQDVFTKIGVSLVSLINLFDPEKIVIGGGVSEVEGPLFETVQNYVSRYVLNPAGRKTEIVPSGLHQHTGLIGAAALIFQSIALKKRGPLFQYRKNGEVSNENRDCSRFI